MRVLFALTALSLALVGCNGGEDFSGATVPGCPAGAGCSESSRGEVLVELVGTRVVNLGYKCGGTNVVFSTKAVETTSVTSDGEAVTVPPYNALCPSSSQNVEFFIGNGLFEGNSVSLGQILFPRQEALQEYTVTVADLKNSPFRESSDLAITRNIAALIQGLDANPSTPEIVEIPQEAHDIMDANPELVIALDTGVYGDFVDQWSVGDTGNDTFFELVNAAVAGGVAGLNPDPDVPLAKVKAANRYTSAGNYSFRSCLFITCLDENPDSAAEEDLVRINLPGRLTNDTAVGQPPMILPNGKVMGIGIAQRSGDSAETQQELVAFSAASTINDLLQLTSATIVSIEDGSNATNLNAQGRFLNQLIYSNHLPENGVGSTDIELNYPTVAESLAVEDEGKLTGDLLSDGVDIPLTAEIEAAPQAEPDQATIDMIAGNGPYTLRMMRACLVGSNEPNPDDCAPINNAEQEAASDGSGNYFPSINGKDVTDEQPRGDYVGGAEEICLEVISNPGQPDNGIVMAGTSDGSCPNTLGIDGYAIGFISRTFIKEDTSAPESANFSMLIAPDAPAVGTTSHFGVTVLGRVDLLDACSPMYRLSDGNFNDGLRAAWVDDYYPYVQQKAWIEDLGTPPEGGFTTSDLPEEQQEFLVSIVQGAVQFFAGLPGGGCDPLVPAP